MTATLTSRIVDAAAAELTKHGHSLGDDDIGSLRAIASTVEKMANGTAEPKAFLSVNPTGWGKTTAIVHSVREIVNDPALAHVGVVIFVFTRVEIVELVKRIGLREDQFIVRVGKSDPDNKKLNAMGLDGLCPPKKADRKGDPCRENAHHRAQVMFTTQAMLKFQMAYHRSFPDMRFFDFCGASWPDNENSCVRPRKVRLWDEQFVPIDPVVVTLEQISHFADRLIWQNQPRAAATLTAWIEHLKTDPLADIFAKVPDWHRDVRDAIIREKNILQAPHEAKEIMAVLKDALTDKDTATDAEIIAAEAMWDLAGKEVKITSNWKKQTVSISYRQSIPHDIEPILIFDAGGAKAVHYRLRAKNAGNVVPLPSVEKTFRNLKVRLYDHAAGHGAYRTVACVEEYANIVAQWVIEKNGEDVLIFHWKGEKAPATTLPDEIRKKVEALGGDVKRLHFRSWGRHKATNNCKDVKHVIVVGVLNVPMETIIGLVYGISELPMHASVSDPDIEAMRMSQVIGDLNQAVGRGATREMIDHDVPEGTTLDIIASSHGGMPFRNPMATLKAMFPGASIKKWLPLDRDPRRADVIERDAGLIEGAMGLLGDAPSVKVIDAVWAKAAGVNASTLRSRLKAGVLVAQLAARGIVVETVPGRGRRLHRAGVLTLP